MKYFGRFPYKVQSYDTVNYKKYQKLHMQRKHFSRFQNIFPGFCWNPLCFQVFWFGLIFQVFQVKWEPWNFKGWYDGCLGEKIVRTVEGGWCRSTDPGVMSVFVTSTTHTDCELTDLFLTFYNDLRFLLDVSTMRAGWGGAGGQKNLFLPPGMSRSRNLKKMYFVGRFSVRPKAFVWAWCVVISQTIRLVSQKRLSSWGGNLPIYWDISCHLVVVVTNSGQVMLHHTPPLPMSIG